MSRRTVASWAPESKRCALMSAHLHPALSVSLPTWGRGPANLGKGFSSLSPMRIGHPPPPGYHYCHHHQTCDRSGQLAQVQVASPPAVGLRRVMIVSEWAAAIPGALRPDSERDRVRGSGWPSFQRVARVGHWSYRRFVCDKPSMDGGTQQLRSHMTSQGHKKEAPLGDGGRPWEPLRLRRA